MPAQLDGMHRAVLSWVCGRVPGDLPSSDARQDGPHRQFSWGACAPAELEEVPMPIVGGLDIHRKQITFDYLDTETRQVLQSRFSAVWRRYRSA
jgi:hypothetical protein